MWDPVREKWDPGGPGGTRVGPGGTRVGQGGHGGTHEDLAGLRWESQDPVLYSVPCLVTLLVFVATVINMEARKVDLNMKP